MSFHIKFEILPKNWFHKNLSDPNQPLECEPPVNEDKMLASVVLRGSECTKVNFIFDKTSKYSRKKTVIFIKIFPEEANEETPSETPTSNGMVTMVVTIEEELLRMIEASEGSTG